MFPKIFATFQPEYIFAFFCFMMLLQLAWVKLMVPETKGIALEAMQHKLAVEGSEFS